MTGILLDSSATGAASNFNPGEAQVLSDGSSLVVYRHDGTALQFKHSTDRVTYTTKNAYTPVTWNTSLQYGLTIDASDNVHLCYVRFVSGSQTVMYVKFTKSAGPTWTAGTAEIVGGCGAFVSAPAVEAMDSATILVGWQDSSTPSVAAKFRLRMTGGAWSSEFSETIAAPPFGSVAGFSNMPPAIARDSVGVSGSNQKFAFLMGGASGTTAVIPFKLGVKSINLTTGAVVSTTIIDAAALGGVNGLLIESFGIFTAGPGVWHGAGSHNSADGIRTIFAFRCSDTAYITGPVAEAFLCPTVVAVGVTYTLNRIVFVDSESGGNLFAKVAAFDDASGLSGIRILPRFSWDTDISGVGNALVRITGGANRNGSFARGDFVAHGSSTAVWVKPHTIPLQISSLYSPLNGSTVTSNNVSLLSNPYATTYGTDRYYKTEYEVSASPAFTPSTFYEAANSEYRLSNGAGFSTTVMPDGVFTQGVWYIRARAVDAWGATGPVSSTNSITVSHPPTVTVVAPEANETTAYAITTEIAWIFGDGWASDYQTAFHVIIERNDTGVSVLDTGKIVQAGGLAGTRNNYLAALSSSLKDVLLRVKVKVWDAQDVASVFSSYNLFTLVDAPAVAILTPPSGVLTNPSPTVSWTFTASGGRTQSSFQVSIAKTDGTVVFNSGTIGGAATSYTPAAVLVNLTNYVYTVRAYDNTSGTVPGVATRSVNTVWDPPADTTSAILDSSTYELSGYVEITWTNETKDPTFHSWQVWRTDVATGEAVMLSETTVDAAWYEFRDYLVSNRKAYLYDVIQIATRFGQTVPSAMGSSAQMSVVVDTLVQGDFWLVHLTDPTLSMALRHVTADKYVPNEIERHEVGLIGRGRKVDYGTEYGPRGVLTAQIRDWTDPATGITETARTIQQRLLLLQATKSTVYLRNPFGDLWLVTMSDVDIDRVAGVGAREFVTVSVPYTGVTGPVTVTAIAPTPMAPLTLDGGTP